MMNPCFGGCIAIQEDAEEFVVPEHLKILETDTDAEKKRKKKAIKAIKNNHRIYVYALELYEWVYVSYRCGIGVHWMCDF